MLWKLELRRIAPETMKTVLRQPDCGARLETAGKVRARYHLVGTHGGAWIYNVESNDELDTLLAPRLWLVRAIAIVHIVGTVARQSRSTEAAVHRRGGSEPAPARLR